MKDGGSAEKSVLVAHDPCSGDIEVPLLEDRVDIAV
jgi:hypothetical protein